MCDVSDGLRGPRGFDRRTHIGLDPDQQTLVQSVVAANPKTIVVLVSSFPQGVTSLSPTT